LVRQALQTLLYPAFLAQRADVMAAAESLRQAAIIAGILKVTPQ
jgi:hypothetical protein